MGKNMINAVNELQIISTPLKKKSLDFVRDFSSDKKKYVFGINIYAEDILNYFNITAFVDDFTDEKTHMGKPIIPSNKVEKDALMLIASGGRIKTAIQFVKTIGIQYLDYASFIRHSDLPLREFRFNENFGAAFNNNRKKFEQTYLLLQDDKSKKQYSDLINFKLSYDVDFLSNFSYLEDSQYFEDFLNLPENGAVFVDIGGYDGFTSEGFIKHYPGYQSIHIFEPDESNLEKSKERLDLFDDVTFYKIGLSNKKENLRFDSSGSTSAISADGDMEISVDRLDDMQIENISFIKMDIEGIELLALKGSKECIKNQHPALAISVYHQVNDFWKIPEYILSLREDYHIFFRHYTESIYESVMFFIPIKEK
jgi:FkbM family methyltransferase